MQTPTQTPVRSRAELHESIRADYLRADTMQMTGEHKIDMRIGHQLVTYTDVGIGVLRTTVDPHSHFEQLFK